LNPKNAYIKRRREYVDLYSSIFYSAELQQEGNKGLALVAGAETLEEARTEISPAGGGGRGRLGICPSTSRLVLAVAEMVCLLYVTPRASPVPPSGARRAPAPARVVAAKFRAHFRGFIQIFGSRLIVGVYANI
jgi:hypothetical protein